MYLYCLDCDVKVTIMWELFLKKKQKKTHAISLNANDSIIWKTFEALDFSRYENIWSRQKKPSLLTYVNIEIQISMKIF